MFSLHKSFLHFIFGMICAYCNPLSTIAQKTQVRCTQKSIYLSYGHCVTSQDGVHDLNCYGKHELIDPAIDWHCVWRPGNHTSKKTYTLAIIQQRKFLNCSVYNDIPGLSQNMMRLFLAYNMTAHIFDPSDPRNCTQAVFRGEPKSLVRCGPPSDMTISRYSRQLDVNVLWREEDLKHLQNYSVRYKTRGSKSWDKSGVQCKHREKCIVGNVNSSLAYEVQVKCVSNDKCPQCPWGEIYTAPPELTVQPVILKMEDVDIPHRKGCRQLLITWEFPFREPAEGYNVTIGKASGEPPSVCMKTTQPEIILILSHTAYHLNITAFNNASTSPAVSRIIPTREDTGLEAGKLNVTFNSNMSFTISWRDDLIKSYCCYSVEWRRRGHKAAYMPFFEDKNHYETISSKEPLEPFKRYIITLHTRPQKPPCSLVDINNSESTYGSMQAYLIEGSPNSAPTNININNVTLNSMMLEWSPIPEEDVRGFLRGYTIFYTEEHQSGTERNVTVDPIATSHELMDLKSRMGYMVQMSGFTSEGEGVRSTTRYFQTNSPDSISLIGSIAVFVVAVALLICVIQCGPRLFKRAKVIFWLNIPNPGNSNAIQKIDGGCELLLLKPINTEMPEEGDANSLHIVEKGAETTPAGSSLLLMFPCLDHDMEAEVPSETHLSATDAEPLSPGTGTTTSGDWFQRVFPSTDTGNADEELSSDMTAVSTSLDTQQQTKSALIHGAVHQSSPFVFASGYTTMEQFHQAIPQVIPAPSPITLAEALQQEETDSTAVRPGLDYVRQSSTSSEKNSDKSSTLL